MPEPEEPLTDLAASAAVHHEIYLSYVEAGFTEAQALDILKTIIVGLLPRSA